MDNKYDEFFNAVCSILDGCEDLVCREVGENGARFSVIFIKGITSRDFISESILRPMMRIDIKRFDGDFSAFIESPSLMSADNPSSAAGAIVRGEVLIIAESANGFYQTLTSAQHTHGRSIGEPESDVTVRGPKAGFVEDAETNMALLRKYIRSPALKFRSFTVGSVSQTKVVLAHVDGRADNILVERISRRIQRLEANVITDSANISMLLSGNKNPPLPSCGSTEKVDKAAAKLMSGRIAIIVDGSPFVLTLPYVFIEGLQSTDDYLHTPYYATFIRLLRLTAFVAAIFAPAVLCAFINHYGDEMPQGIYGVIVDSRTDIPLSFFWEITVILLLFEILREVGVRMPRTVGDAVGIVGSIILGNTAVEAGIVSSIGVITVAFSAVCAFITPAYMYVIVISRFLVLFLSEIMGVYGLALSALLFLIALFRKKSFGVSYMSPLFPFDRQGMLDFILCWPKRTLGRIEDLKPKK